MRNLSALSYRPPLQVGSASTLDLLEAAAERTRSQLGVCTLSVSCVRGPARDLRTLVNTGQLGPGEQRRPPAESYALRAFPAAAALVVHRRPYLSTPGAAADPASMALEARLEKTSQAAAPLVIGEKVWGELWVASTATGLPLTRAELPLICWAAERFGHLLGDLLGDGSEPDLASTDRSAPGVARRYEIWINGHVSDAVAAALIAAPARRHQRYTIFEAAFEQADLYALLARLNELAVSLVAVQPPQSPTPTTRPSSIGRHRAVAYDIRLGGHIAAEQLRPNVDCTIRHEAGHAVVTARLDQTGLGGLLRQLALIGADLLSLHPTSARGRSC